MSKLGSSTAAEAPTLQPSQEPSGWIAYEHLHRRQSSRPCWQHRTSSHHEAIAEAKPTGNRGKTCPMGKMAGNKAQNQTIRWAQRKNKSETCLTGEVPKQLAFQAAMHFKATTL